MEKHFVTFLSPGTFVAETNTEEVQSWDVDWAVEKSRSITQRYNAKPYGFFFTTRTRGSEDFDSKESARSGIYYLGGDVLTLEDVKARNNPKDSALISNMECNGYDRIIENRNSFLTALPLYERDTVLDYSI